MKIRKLTLENFRGYNDPISITFDALTVFVGRNDVGKSTILEALEIFFGDGKGLIKSDAKDVNVQSRQTGNSDFSISVEFDELPSVVTLDRGSVTTLRQERLLNSEGRLEVVKKFGKGANPKVYINAVHPTNPYCADLLLKKNSDLKAIIDKHDISCGNKTNNALLRQDIWNYFSNDLQERAILIEVAKEDAKAIWTNLARYMPVYSLFQADRKNTDSDNEVQDPLQQSIKQILADPKLQNTLVQVAKEVSQRIREVSDRTLTKLKELDASVAETLNPVFPTPEMLRWSDVFKKVSITGDEDIPINKRGSGVKRLVLLSFFRAEAERRCQSGGGTSIVYAIEEPETSQHVANQRVLIEALKTIAKSQNTQIILTTHSGHIVKELDFNNLRLISNVDGRKKILSIRPGVLRYPSLNEVNYSAFGDISEEYHDELYGFLEQNKWLNEYKATRPHKPYIRIDPKDGHLSEEKIFDTGYIRHQIHHPENTRNPRFSREDLKISIEAMIQYIREKAESEGLWDNAEEY